MAKYIMTKADKEIIRISKLWGIKAHLCNEHGAFAFQNGSNICPICKKESPEYNNNK
jgi:hypothetical protein